MFKVEKSGFCNTEIFQWKQDKVQFPLGENHNAICCIRSDYHEQTNHLKSLPQFSLNSICICLGHCSINKCLILLFSFTGWVPWKDHISLEVLWADSWKKCFVTSWASGWQMDFVHHSRSSEQDTSLWNYITFCKKKLN